MIENSSNVPAPVLKKRHISLPIIVEGRYDKSALSGMFDCTAISVGGFAVFNSKEKQALLRKICQDGVIILTDSDAGGRQIRSFLAEILPPEKLYNAYIPQISGKEKRKKKAGKAGTLGVEGMDKITLEKALAPFFDDGGRVAKNDVKGEKMLTKVDFFEHKLTGAAGSAERRDKIAISVGLPAGMTPNLLLSALNILYSYEDALKVISNCEEKP